MTPATVPSSQDGPLAPTYVLSCVDSEGRQWTRLTLEAVAEAPLCSATFEYRQTGCAVCGRDSDDHADLRGFALRKPAPDHAYQRRQFRVMCRLRSVWVAGEVGFCATHAADNLRVA